MTFWKFTNCFLRVNIICFGMILFLQLSGCNQGTPHSTTITLRPQGGPNSGDKIDQDKKECETKPPTPSFAELNQSVFKTNCYGCHNSRHKPILISYSDYQQNLPVVIEQVLNLKRMPKNHPLNEDELLKIKIWVDAGAPEGEPAPPPKPPEVAVDWQLINDTFFKAKCAGCHRAGNEFAISDFSSKELVKASIATIHFATVIASTMPPAPKDHPEGLPNPNQLSIEEKRLLADWIVLEMP